MTINQVIIWGYPLHSHTHSYVHSAWMKAFKHLGYTVYWFHDSCFDDNLDYTNTLFITEGHVDNAIPIHPTNIYFVHACIHPNKYIQSGARLVDIRYHVAYLHDSVYDYNLDEKIKAGVVNLLPNSLTYYEKNASDHDLNHVYRSGAHNYEAIYMFWATDLLPHEIDFKDRFISHVEPPSTYFVGSIGTANIPEISRFQQGCVNNQISFHHINPWSAPISDDDNRKLIQNSIIAPDIRGDANPCSRHKTIGYIPCRLFKNISYGALGATNSLRIKQMFGDYVVYHDDEAELVKLCLEKTKDKDFILNQMEWVANNHTFINRIQDLMSVVNTLKL